ncbi:uncharacterized protein LOC115213345 [Octopus sinensis]|uniref:Uncharacterized protein LOC115213345 n=1 Tax=Octopus sinensis TaxID=2607531 RepID=A0A6P7SIT3_9MOLL|nr:uncharacterized protein LOC115213345 [Octopus sinensis]
MRSQLFGDNFSGDFSKQPLPVAAEEMAVSHVDTPVDTVDDQHINYQNLNWLCERAILVPKNTFVAKLNKDLLRSLPGNLYTYKSVDTVVDQEEAVNFPREFFNSFDSSGLSPHQLHLKIGAPIMLLKNLESPVLCNGTHLVLKKCAASCY